MIKHKNKKSSLRFKKVKKVFMALSLQFLLYIVYRRFNFYFPEAARLRHVTGHYAVSRAVILRSYDSPSFYFTILQFTSIF